MSFHRVGTTSRHSYRDKYREGIIAARAQEALGRLRSCDLCPWNCGADRSNDQKGRCGVGRDAVIASYGPHFGEEAPISGRNGSGTIFFSGCNLSCVFCQNHDISQTIKGRTVTAKGLAEIMLELEGFGCHNINLVSPTHVVPQVLEALDLAVMRGLDIPLVYNTGGYDLVSTLELLDGIVDIYMPDMKFSDPETGLRLCGAPDYHERNKEAVLEMHRQVGDLVLGGDGAAVKGLLVRHLVLPNGLAGTSRTVEFLSSSVSKDTYINIMTQYHPEYRAIGLKGLDRRPYPSELKDAYDMARGAGLHRFDG